AAGRGLLEKNPGPSEHAVGMKPCPIAQIGVFVLATAISALLAACSKSEGTQCVDDRTCGAHMRCNLAGRPVGICQACGPVEIPYNGMDDDCDPRTRDIDLDSDG